MKKYDLIVVGAGPAGFLAAKAAGDAGLEVAFAGRSNAGKSSALNTLCKQKNLARTSKTPGRTQLLNFFALDAQRRLVSERWSDVAPMWPSWTATRRWPTSWPTWTRVPRSWNRSIATSRTTWARTKRNSRNLWRLAMTETADAPEEIYQEPPSIIGVS